MKRRNGRLGPLPSPLRLFLTVLAIVFLAEAVTMTLVQVFLPGVHSVATSIADASMLIALCAPVLWWFIARPLRSSAAAEHGLAASVVEHAADGIIIINEQGQVELFNPAAERIFGYAAAEVLGKPLTLLMPERYRDAHQRGLERVRSTGESRIIGKTVEMHGLRKDGSEFPLELSLVSWETGEGTFYTGIVRDITQRKQDEERLREANDALDAVIQASPMGIAILDSDGNVKLWNPAAERMFGWRREEVLGRPLPSIPPDKREEHRSFRERVLRGEAYSDAEIVRQKKDGSLIDISLSTAPLRDAEGDIWGAMGIMADITERKQAQEALQEAHAELEQRVKERTAELRAANEALQREIVERKRLGEAQARLVAILEATPDFVGFADARDTRILYINRAGRKMTGIWEDEDVTKLKIADVHPEWTNKLLFDEVIPMAIREGAWRGECAFLNRDGREIPVLMVLIAHKTPSGEVEVFSTISRDISQRKRAEEQIAHYAAQLETANAQLQEAMSRLEEASQHKSEFLANMSHELRTPLNSILGFSQLLRDPTFGALSEEQARYVGNIKTSGQHLLALIDDLLDLSKVEAGKLELRPESVNLAAALQAALATIRPQAEAKGLTLHLDVALGLPRLTADAVRLNQILYNILSNAVKFTPDGGWVTVTAKMVSRSEFGVSSSQPETRSPKPETASASEFVEIAVQDTGIGIKAEDLPRLFQPFTQLESPLAKGHQGTGLGLALTKQLVERHGGQIWAASEGEGRGSTFTVRLPLGSTG